MNVALFVRSYPNDFQWLRYSIQSMQKYLTGVEEKILVVPWNTLIPSEIEIFFDHIVESYEYENMDGYVAQQWDKMDAYKYTDKDYILYSDSDCIYTAPFDVSELFKEGRPILPLTPYEELKGDGGYAWKEITEKLLGYEVRYEFMRRHPNIHYRDTLVAFAKDYPNLYKRVTGRNVSEFNLLGAYAFKKELNYYFTEIADTVPCKQYWSYSGLTNEERAEIEGYINAD